jgi:hypothetical protein
MANITDDKVIKLLKSNPDQSMQFYANKLGVPLGAVGAYVYRLEPVANPKLKIPATEASVTKARDSEGLRWERIAARTGKSVAEAKRLYKGDPNKSYTGRGRDFSGTARKATSSGAGTKGRQAATGKGTSGRRAAASGSKSTGRAAGRTRGQKTAGRSAGRSPS